MYTCTRAPRSYVGVPGDAGGRLIVTQAPLTNTIGDFWRMVWEQRAGSVVVMATEEEERWWPQGQGASQRHSLVIGRSWAEGKPLLPCTSKYSENLG